MERLKYSLNLLQNKAKKPGFSFVFSLCPLFLCPLFFCSLFFCTLFFCSSSFSETLIVEEKKDLKISNLGVDFSPWSNFSENIKNCKAGIFNLPDPAEISILSMVLGVAAENQKKINDDEIKKAILDANIVYEIKGLKDGRCMMSVTRAVRNTMKPGEEINQMDCEFLQKDLPILEQAAQKIATGKVEFDSMDPSQKLMNDSCKSIIKVKE